MNIEPDSRHETYKFDDKKCVEIARHRGELQVGFYREDTTGVVLFAGKELVKLYRILVAEVGSMSESWGDGD